MAYAGIPGSLEKQLSDNTHDLIVIGTGTAATVIAKACRQADWTVAVIDHRPFGGTWCFGAAIPRRYCWPPPRLSTVSSA